MKSDLGLERLVRKCHCGCDPDASRVERTDRLTQSRTSSQYVVNHHNCHIRRAVAALIGERPCDVLFTLPGSQAHRIRNRSRHSQRGPYTDRRKYPPYPPTEGQEVFSTSPATSHG